MRRNAGHSTLPDANNAPDPVLTPLRLPYRKVCVMRPRNTLLPPESGHEKARRAGAGLDLPRPNEARAKLSDAAQAGTLCASTNQRARSAVRLISVKRSAVPSSPASLASSIALRMFSA